MPKASKPMKPCKMAVSSLGNSIDDNVGPLGRSTYFFIFQGSPEKFIVVDNPSRTTGVNAGVATAKALVDAKVDIVVTGTIGKRAFAALKDAGIMVKAGCEATVAEAAAKCAAGELKECEGATFAGKTI